MVLHLSSLQSTLSMTDGERGTKSRHQIFLDAGLRFTKIHQELATTLGADAYARSQIKIWLQKFRNGNLSCKNAPRTRRPLLTLGPQLAAFLQKFRFASTMVLAQHFLTNMRMIKEILQRDMGLKILAALDAPLSVSRPERLFVLKHQ
jgi:hypothetical protein